MNPTTYAATEDGEVFIYVRGRLVMKRWLRTGASVVFNVAPGGTQWNR